VDRSTCQTGPDGQIPTKLNPQTGISGGMFPTLVKGDPGHVVCLFFLQSLVFFTYYRAGKLSREGFRDCRTFQTEDPANNWDIAVYFAPPGRVAVGWETGDFF